MPRPSQKLKIIDAALSCFAQFGYDGTRIHQIAARAGVSEGALYKHYPSKEAIAQELFAFYFSLVAGHLQQIAASDLPADQQLRGMAQTVLNDYREHPDAFNFALVRRPSFVLNLPPGTVFPMDIVESVIRVGQQAGLIRAGRPNLLASIFFGCVIYPIIFANTADLGAIDLIHETFLDATILESALAAIST